MVERNSDHQADGALRRAQDAIKIYAMSMYAILGHPSPGDERLGQFASASVSFLSPDDLRHPEKPNLAALGQLQQMVLADIGANRPRNDFSAEAARAAQATGGGDGPRGLGFGTLDALRAGSSARFRDMASESSMKGGSGQGSTGAPVTPEFARSFAGTGMVGGTLRTFAAVGLDRDTFNAFRDEGFSKAQIAASAQDTKMLGWKGKEDLSIAQHALPEARKAAIAVEQAKTPAELAQAQAREAEAAAKANALPDDDPRKHGTQHFFQHVIKKSQHAERHKAVGVGAQEHDTAVAQDQAGSPRAPHAAAQDGMIAKYSRQKTAVVDASADDAFGAPSASQAPATKPAPIRTANAKPAAPSVG